MPFETETMRGETPHVRGATCDFEDTTAGPAAEVVMMFFPCQLVPLGFSRQFYNGKPTVVHQGF
ncbi:hypothetical protein NKDENANG_02011 [Candidatus Entotheonellaceae bacterium PAL068K]